MKLSKVVEVVALCGGLILSNCSEGDSNNEEEVRQVTGLTSCAVKLEGYYYIGDIMSFTGSLGSFGPMIEQAIILAIQEINADGGINGKKLGLISCDDKTDGATAKSVMAELRNASPVGAVVGATSSSATIEASTEAIPGKKVLMSYSATSPAVTDLADDGYVFRTCVSDAVQGVIAATIAKRETYKNVFIINRDDAYGTGLRTVFTSNFEGGDQKIEYVTYKEEDTNYWETVIAAASASFSGAGPDAVFLVAYVDDGAAILKQAIDSGWTAGDPKWILPDGPKDPQLITKVNNNAFLEGVHGTNPASPTSADFQTFTTNYKAMWNKDPTVFNANGYDAAFLIAIAMALAENPDDGTQIRDKLAKTHSGTAIHVGEWEKVLLNLSAGEVNFEGASGLVDFDDKGDVLSNIEEWTIQSGQIVSVGCFKPDGNPCE